jgi:hypothetical protein
MGLCVRRMDASVRCAAETVTGRICLHMVQIMHCRTRAVASYDKTARSVAAMPPHTGVQTCAAPSMHPHSRLSTPAQHLVVHGWKHMLRNQVSMISYAHSLRVGLNTPRATSPSRLVCLSRQVFVRRQSYVSKLPHTIKSLYQGQAAHTKDCGKQPELFPVHSRSVMHTIAAGNHAYVVVRLQ